MRSLSSLKTVAVVAAVLLAAGGAAAADLHMTTSDRTPVRWQDWIDEHGPAAVLVWASWAPEAEESLKQVAELRRTAAGNGMGFVIVAVQEEFSAAASRLSRSGAEWLHDRHGAILKEYRLIRVPFVIVVDRQGRMVSRSEPSATALAEALSPG